MQELDSILGHRPATALLTGTGSSRAEDSQDTEEERETNGNILYQYL